MKTIVKRIALLLCLLLTWAVVSVFGALNGWWLTPLSERDNVNGFTNAIEQQLESQTKGNIAIVLLEEGHAVYENYDFSQDNINRQTLFPVASMSKMFTALGVIKLAELNPVSLEQPVDELISRWQLPESSYNRSKVTLRALLSHTAGLTDGLGFADYTQSQEVPDLLESLTAPRASSGVREIKIGYQPGSEWQYSGGGYLITELVIEEQTGVTFENWMQSHVFMPTAMNTATYDFIGSKHNHSASYDKDGVESSLYYYASPAATGLSLSAGDLIQFVSSDLLKNNTDTLINPLGFKLGAPIWGSGAMLYAPSPNGKFIFGHDGANEPAINSTVRINPDSGDALIVLTTGGDYLASQIGYEWVLWQSGYPDFLNFEKAIASAWVPLLLGSLIIVLAFFFLLRFSRKKPTAVPTESP